MSNILDIGLNKPDLKLTLFMSRGSIMSYRENSILASLVITLVIWGNYIAETTTLYQQQLLSTESINNLLFSVVIYTIALEIISQIIVAIFKAKEANELSDERDKLISMRANSYAYNILSVGVICIIFSIIFPSITQSLLVIPELTKEYKLLHLVIIFGVIAEISRLFIQLFAYRRGF
jgi:magnesium-transporting ATPase (P-type)